MVRFDPPSPHGSSGAIRFAQVKVEPTSGAPVFATDVSLEEVKHWIIERNEERGTPTCFLVRHWHPVAKDAVSICIESHQDSDELRLALPFGRPIQSMRFPAGRSPDVKAINEGLEISGLARGYGAVPLKDFLAKLCDVYS